MTDTTPAAPCPNTETLLALAHGELPLATAQRLETHLRECPACAEEITIMKTISSEIGGLAGAVEAPAGLRGRVLSSLRFRERRTQWNIFDGIRIGAATAAGAIALMVIVSQLPLSNMITIGGGSTPRDRHAVSTASTPASTAPNAAAAGRPMAATSSAPGAAQQQGMAGYPGGGAAGMPSAVYGNAVAPGGLNGDLHGQQYRAKLPSRTNPFSPNTELNGVTPDDVRRYTHGEAIQDPKRKVVHNLTLGVRVNRQLEGLQDEITSRVRKDGGYVENANLNSTAEGERTAEMTLRVPVERFDTVTQWLSGLGEVKTKSASGEDVTGTWVDQRAELREFRAEEERLQKEYDKAKTAAAREMVRYQLLRLRTRIRASEERFALTTKLAALATIHLSLTEEPQARARGSLLPDMDNTFQSALSAFMIAVRIPLGALIWLAVFSPLWVPCVLLYRWATRKALERDLATKPAA